MYHHLMILYHLVFLYVYLIKSYKITLYCFNLTLKIVNNLFKMMMEFMIIYNYKCFQYKMIKLKHQLMIHL